MPKPLLLSALILFTFISFSNEFSEDVSEESMLDEQEVLKTITLSVSPYRKAARNKEEEYTLLAEGTINKGHHELLALYEKSYFSTLDFESQIFIKSAVENIVITYDINHFWGDFTYFLLYQYKRETQNNTDIIPNNHLGGIFGLKYDIIEDGKIWKEWSVSFIPLYEYLKENVELNQNGTFIVEQYKRNNIRNSMRMKLKFEFFEGKVTIKDTFFYSPAYNLDEKKFVSDDVDIKNKVKISYNINENFSITLSNEIIRNERVEKLRRYPRNEQIDMFTIDYTLIL